jgi:hypothetical protein
MNSERVATNQQRTLAAVTSIKVGVRLVGGRVTEQLSRLQIGGPVCCRASRRSSEAPPRIVSGGAMVSAVTGGAARPPGRRIIS